MANNKLFLRSLPSPYVGNAADVTKNSVLTHSDVDNNFIFLKGEDVLTATTQGTTIVLNKVNGDTVEVDITPIIASTDNFTTGATLDGSTLYFDTTLALSAYTADLTPLLDDTNYFTTGGTVGGDNIIYFDRNDALSAFTIDLNQFAEDNNSFTSGATLIDQTIYYDRNDGLSAYTVDMSGLVPNTDYGNIIFVSEAGSTGLTRSEVIGNINIPVDIELASQIAQSGDTIHVKSGTYNLTITGDTGLCVDGVNHYFEPNSKVYKSTTGPMFGKFSITQGNVFGSGSFYGSGSCGAIFFNSGSEGDGHTQVYEWDICENTVNSCYVYFSNENSILTGKRRIISSGGIAIFNVSSSNSSSLVVNCPEIRSTISAGLLINSTLGPATSGTTKITINANEIIGSSPTTGGLWLDYHYGELDCTVNASHINYVTNFASGTLRNLILNVARVDVLFNFSGSYLKMNGHLGWFNNSVGGGGKSFIADLGLVDRCWSNGTGVINATFNGDFDYTSDSQGTNLISSITGPITCNYRLQKGIMTPPYTYGFVTGWFFSFASSALNMLGNWDIQNTWLTFSGGRLNIPSGTVINIGPENPVNAGGPSGFGLVGETFNIGATDVNIGGTIIERCAIGGFCDDSQSAHTYSNTIMYVPTWYAGPPTSTRVVYNGATIIVRDQNSQIITTPVSGGTIGVYNAGLNTNKINSFSPEQEKVRVSVTGTSASYTVNGETFTSTTGATAAASAAELVVLTNASGTLAATASQDTDGVDEYFYIEADVAGDALTLSYGVNTLKDVTIRYNTKSIIDNVGGGVIESPNIVKDLYN